MSAVQLDGAYMYMGTDFFLHYFLTGQCNISGRIKPTFLLVSSDFVSLVACLCISKLSGGGEKEDYIKCGLIGGGSPRHSNIILNTLYIVAIVDCTREHHVRNIRTYHTSCTYCSCHGSTAPLL